MSRGNASDVMRGNLELIVLSVLSDGRKYGYLIQKCVSEASGREVRLQAGTLYPLLHKLEADKLVRASWDDSTGRRRKWYELTPKGRKLLDRQVVRWQLLVRCMDRLLPGTAES